MSDISFERIDKTIRITDRMIGSSDTINIQGDPFIPLIYSDDSVIRAWSWLVGDHPIVKIVFPKPEGHWHYQWRMFTQRLRRACSELRFRIGVLLHGYEDPCDYCD